MSEALRLQSVQLHAGNQYEPKHTRSVYFDTEARTFIARATIGADVIVEVEGVNNIDALMTLSSRLVPIFRALCADALTDALELQPQEPPLDHADSCNFFQPTQAKPFVYTPAAFDSVGILAMLAALRLLQEQALEHNGIDYLQVFKTRDGRVLWFIEDGEGGAITALLPSDY